MSPDLLAQYLDVLKKAGVMTAGLEIPLEFSGSIQVAKMTVYFEPAPGPASETSPGGWKNPQQGKPFQGPQNLDQPFEELPL